MQPLGAGLKRCAITTRDSLLRPGSFITATCFALPSSSKRGLRHLVRSQHKHKMGEKRPADNYDKWTKDGLVARLRHLESELKRHQGDLHSLPAHASPSPERHASKRRKEAAKIEPANYHTRFIALRLAYLGRNYGGYEYASSGLLPSVEEELFKALTKSCLIFPKDSRVVDFEGLDYSKCGRTDRGVSAFGQVIALRVRSARPMPEVWRRKQMEKRAKEKKQKEAKAEKEKKTQGVNDAEVGAAASTEMEVDDALELAPEDLEPPLFDPIHDELPYAKMLNRMLPRDIRILAWCPDPPADFSARFSCLEREYRYFFTQPAFLPPSQELEGGQPHPGWLDIEAMRDAARRFQGEQDFANFCKVDPAKNISNYSRYIAESDIYEADDMSSRVPHINMPGSDTARPPASASDQGPHPKVYYYRVRGSAFLWHQIRHMVSVLFHVGQGLESPDIVDKLLDTKTMPGRPVYVMADEMPLVLWHCQFAGDEGAPSNTSRQPLSWIHVEDDVDPNKNGAAFGAVDGMWNLWREKKMDEILANGLLRVMARDGRKSKHSGPGAEGNTQAPRRGEYSVKRFNGGDGGEAAGRYKPILKMKTMDTPRVQCDRYAQKKGFANYDAFMEHRRAQWDAAGKGTEKGAADE